MEITDVSVQKLEVELDEWAGVSGGRGTDLRPAAIVRIDTDEGITGIGEGYGPEPYVVETIVEQKFAPTLIGEDPLEIERLWDEMVTGGLYWNQKGQDIAAVSGIDLALWDIAGKHHGVPVYELLGGSAHGDRVRPYASDLFWDDPDALAETAAGYVDEGFRAVKTHLGRGLEADRERVAAIRNAIGDAELMVDINCWYDRDDALRVGRMLEEYDVYWYEEPVSPYDVDGHAMLREKLEVPIASGENEFTKWGFFDLFQADAVDYAMPDVMRCGGITEARKICATAESFRTTVTPHNYSTGVGLAATVHLFASSPACKWLEYDTTGYDLYEPLVSWPIDVDDDGMLPLPDEPGLGVQLPDWVVEEYGVA